MMKPTLENDLLERIAAALSEQNELSMKLLWEAQTNRRTQEVLRLAATSPILDDVQRFARQHQLGFIETIKSIRNNKLSFTRFGDGEMRIMLRPEYKLAFQKNSPALAAALEDVISTTAEKLLIGFPHVYRDVHWSGVWADVWGQMKPLIAGHAEMGNAHVTRPIFFQLTGQEGVRAWRSVWEGLSIKVVAGKDSRFEATPELFNSAARITFEYSLPTEAFSDIPRLMDILSNDDSDLILISLGPAGTVLTAKLAAIGKRAIDIGHISDSYKNVFSNGAWPESKPTTVAS
ncbi:GT-D fold domain-containing glycosyltransferase [Arthrobacter sp. H35-D1]|uniref:GT-D fold domain-containing glycosyltransferase n=1 Tax=Arthrobacter sp. H35-D1 TaxID=3046202 RepID=UPI0024BA4CCA|nr:GT-D fold domain-containing glycosyltransferase [Arthrobacter sp. H35-D1]MDJ0313885.1 GT-D fold domain-containing glycosyltransferase [Arthrobacter sp. H35-D1]